MDRKPFLTFRVFVYMFVRALFPIEITIMALKDLAAQKAALTEEAIEAIVADHVRYDIDEAEIAFTPGFNDLGNKSKILVYLVALQGWPFVTDDAIATGAKPAQMENVLAIPGGTLRPTLKDLKDRHLITVKGGVYSVRGSSLPSVESEVKSSSSASPPAKKKTKKKTTKKTRGSGSGSTTKNAGLGEKFEEFVAEGFFDDGKTAKDIRDRFHEETIMVSTSVLPPYFIKAVGKDKTLKRKKEDIDGRKVWVYTTKK